MSSYLVTPTAERQIADIEEYTAGRWGDRQAATYIQEMFATFARIAGRRMPWRRLPAATGVDGYKLSWGGHVIYWRLEDDGEVVIVAVLHGAMDQLPRLREAIGRAERD